MLWGTSRTLRARCALSARVVIGVRLLYAV
jgi:hypothetical protein